MKYLAIVLFGLFSAGTVYADGGVSYLGNDTYRAYSTKSPEDVIKQLMKKADYSSQEYSVFQADGNFRYVVVSKEALIDVERKGESQQFTAYIKRPVSGYVNQFGKEYQDYYALEKGLLPKATVQKKDLVKIVEFYEKLFRRTHKGYAKDIFNEFESNIGRDIWTQPLTNKKAKTSPPRDKNGFSVDYFGLLKLLKSMAAANPSVGEAISSVTLKKEEAGDFIKIKFNTDEILGNPDAAQIYSLLLRQDFVVTVPYIGDFSTSRVGKGGDTGYLFKDERVLCFSSVRHGLDKIGGDNIETSKLLDTIRPGFGGIPGSLYLQVYSNGRKPKIRQTTSTQKVSGSYTFYRDQWLSAVFGEKAKFKNESERELYAKKIGVDQCRAYYEGVGTWLTNDLP